MDAVVVTGLSPANFPPATVAGPVLFKLLAQDGSTAAQQSATADAAATNVSVTFGNVQNGTYTVSAERQDSAGNTLGTAVVSEPFTVNVPQDVTITVPASVVVTQQ